MQDVQHDSFNILTNDQKKGPWQAHCSSEDCDIPAEQNDHLLGTSKKNAFETGLANQKQNKNSQRLLWCEKSFIQQTHVVASRERLESVSAGRKQRNLLEAET